MPEPIPPEAIRAVADITEQLPIDVYGLGMSDTERGVVSVEFDWVDMDAVLSPAQLQGYTDAIDSPHVKDIHLSVKQTVPPDGQTYYTIQGDILLNTESNPAG